MIISIYKRVIAFRRLAKPFCTSAEAFPEKKMPSASLQKPSADLQRPSAQMQINKMSLNDILKTMYYTIFKNIFFEIWCGYTIWKKYIRPINGEYSTE